MTYDVRPKRKNKVFEKKFKCGIVPQCGVIFKKIRVKRVDHFLVEQLLECSGPARRSECRTARRTGTNGTSYTAYTALSFPSNVLHTEKTRTENGFERIQIKPSSDMEPVCTRLKTDWNGLQSVYTIHIIYFWKAANV